MSREQHEPPARTGAIVLAGGRSARFGSDKLEARIGGHSLLERAIEAVQAIVPVVIVCASPGRHLEVPPSVAVAHDATGFEGPLAGVATGLAAMPVDIDRILVVAADMPMMAPAVLRDLLDRVQDAAAACLLDGDGRPRPLPSAYRRGAASLAVGALLASGERRLRALPERLGAIHIAESAWRARDPTGETLRDIDSAVELGARRSMLDRVAEIVIATRTGERALVAIDGVDGAGKSTFADEVAEAIGDRRPVVRASVDRFHRPKAARYARGRASPDGYYLDSFDLEALTARLLDPFKTGAAIVTGVFDHRRDAAVVDDPIDPPADAVLLFDGIFLHRPELASRWDLSIFLDVSAEVAVARMAVRDGSDPDPGAPSNARYVEGQRRYIREADPARRADLVIEQDDLWRPRLLPRRQD